MGNSEDFVCTLGTEFNLIITWSAFMSLSLFMTVTSNCFTMSSPPPPVSMAYSTSRWTSCHGLTANFFMQDSEEVALCWVAYKPTCWFPYMDDTFKIWPHGSKELKNFHDYLINIHPDIQFTMKTELNGHLPFLDTNIYIWLLQAHSVQETHTRTCI
jgi:hypothetical protein